MPSVDLPSFEDVCNPKSFTIRFFPHKARPDFARVLSAALKAVASDNSVDSWLKLCMLHKCVLPSFKHRGHHNKPVSINRLCDLQLKGNFGELRLKRQI